MTIEIEDLEKALSIVDRVREQSRQIGATDARSLMEADARADAGPPAINGLPLFESSEDTSALDAAMAEFLAECPPIPQSGWNPHFSSKYSLLSDIHQTANPILGRVGVRHKQSTNVRVTTREVLNEKGEPEVRHGARLIIVTELRHGESGQWERHYGEWPVDHDGRGRPAQSVKAAQTYARAGELAAALGVSPGEDTDGEGDQQSRQGGQRGGTSGRQARATSSGGKGKGGKAAAAKTEGERKGEEMAAQAKEIRAKKEKATPPPVPEDARKPGEEERPPPPSDEDRGPEPAEEPAPQQAEGTESGAEEAEDGPRTEETQLALVRALKDYQKRFKGHSRYRGVPAGPKFTQAVLEHCGMGDKRAELAGSEILSRQLLEKLQTELLNEKGGA